MSKTQVIDYDIYTCANTPKGLWLGTMDIKTTISGAAKSSVGKEKFYLDLSEGSYSIPGWISFTGKIEGDKIAFEKEGINYKTKSK